MNTMLGLGEGDKMADNIYTLLKFKNKKAYDHFIKNYVTFGKDEKGEYFFFDLAKVIPYPTRENCPDQYNMESKRYDKLACPNNKGHLQLLKGYEFLDWYKWCSVQWGTKWNTYENRKNDEKLEFKFSTAWATPYNVIRTFCNDNPEIYRGLEGISCCEFNGFHKCDTFIFNDWLETCNHDTDPRFYTPKELTEIPLFKHLFKDWTDEGWSCIVDQHKSYLEDENDSI